MSDPIITRFAPSPTGYLHIGGARTALFNWLLARHSGGKFLLRIEDTDQARSTDEACQKLQEDLKWLGLQWDNTDLIHQSKRTAVYNALIDDLIARGLAYKAYETQEELEKMRVFAKGQLIYRRGNVPAPSPADIARYEAEGRPHVVRFAMPVKEYRFRDVVLDKEIVVSGQDAQDFVIRKSDGMPTYHFAVVVDDAEMKITHVLRGQEHLLNTVNHIALQEALGYPRPIYGHLSIILNTDKSKMGKRDRDKKVRATAQVWMRQQKPPQTAADIAAKTGIPAQRISEWLADDQKQLDLSEQAAVMAVVGLKESDMPEVLVHDFRKSGYLPEVLVNFLALLGWNPGGDRERMTVKELIALFRLEDIGKSNSSFNREKLLAFNTEVLARAAAADTPRLIAAFRDFLAANPESAVNAATDEQVARLVKMKPGMRTLRDVEEQSRFFFIPDAKIAYDPAAVEKVLKKGDGQGLAALKDLLPLLEAIGESDWTHAVIELAVTAYATAKGLGLGKVAQPLRVAISGGTISPPIFESLEFLGRARTLARIRRCLAEVR